MFAKMLIYDDEGSRFYREQVELVDGKNHLPAQETHIFEAEKVSYRHVRIKGLESHYRIMGELTPNCSFLTPAPFNFEDTKDPKNEDVLYTLLIVTVLKKGEQVPTHYCATGDVILWLMNEEGKTVDKTNIRGLYKYN